MIFNSTDIVSFRRYVHNFKLLRKKCDCGGKFNNVMLERSDRETLQVGCSNDKCLQFTLASRIPHRPIMRLQIIALLNS